MSTSPQISILIPCYNAANTIKETLESIRSQNFDNWEAIIINDGSTDDTENIAKHWMSENQRFHYLKKTNGGLASARNLGLRHSNGQYIIPLDSDNLIRPDFSKNAIEILEGNTSIDIVYGDAMYFGERNEKWEVGEFDKYKILNHNYIDACACMRKSMFDEIGGFDENLPYQGHEDWELWLRAIEYGKEFFYLNEITFEYRVSKNSMINSFTDSMLADNINYIRNKHFSLYLDAIRKLQHENQQLKQELSMSFFKRVLRKLKNL